MQGTWNFKFRCKGKFYILLKFLEIQHYYDDKTTDIWYNMNHRKSFVMAKETRVQSPNDRMLKLGPA